MKANEIRVGGVYTAKVSNNVVEVRVDSINKREGNDYRKGGTGYSCTNLKTGREVHIKSAAKFRAEVKGDDTPVISGGLTPKFLVNAKMTMLSPSRNDMIASIVVKTAGDSKFKQDLRKKLEALDDEAVWELYGTLLTPEILEKLFEGEQSLPPIAPAASAARAISTVRPAGTYSCCQEKVGSPHRVDCPLFPVPTAKASVPITETATRPVVSTASASSSGSASAVKVGKTPAQIIAERNAKTLPVPMKDGGRLQSGAMTAPQVSSLAARVQQTQNRYVAPSGGAKHLIVIARAGTGKTWTLTKGLTHVFSIKQDVTPSDQQRAIWDVMAESRGLRHTATGMVCFNNPIAAELRTKVPNGCKAMTNHVMGSICLRRHYKLAGGDDGNGVVDTRVLDIVCELMGKDRQEMSRTHPGLSGILKELVGLCKQNLTGYDPVRKVWMHATNESFWNTEILTLADHYGVDLANEEMDGDNFQDYTNLALQWVPKILERCKDVNRDKCIDFNDMIWLPVVLNLPIFVNDLLMVDEAQDLNPCQQALVIRAGKRLILCGDPKQAIYGFAGADVDSIPNMERMLGATDRGVQTLPLNVTRRCGKAIVAEAQKIVPDFYAHESNPAGLVKHAKYEIPQMSVIGPNDQMAKSYHSSVQQGDMLLCRVNAPLVSQCFKFLKEGRAANIQGRNIGKGIIDLINKLECQTVPELITKVDEWAHYETQKENARKDPSDARLIAISDKAECLRSFTDGSRTLEDVRSKVSKIFVDNESGTPKDVINLSSIHKCKGLEAQRVFLLEPEGAKVPHPMAKSAWQKEQEMNLRYVAVTRAIGELTYVS